MEKKHSLWCAAAMIAPATQVASRSTWPEVLVAAVVVQLLAGWSVPAKGWIRMVQKLWAAVIAGQILRWSTAYWETMPFRSVVPFLILALALWTARKAGKSQRIGCVLFMPLLVGIGVVMLSGLPEVNVQNLKPAWQSPSWAMIPILLFPSIVSGGVKKTGSWGISAVAIVVSLITAGVLSPGVSRGCRSGIYELSRSLSLLGVAERFESLVASVMTLGCFCSVSFLLGPEESKEGGLWMYAAAAAIGVLLEKEGESWIVAVITVIIWIILPKTNNRKNNLKKREKSP